MSVPWLGIVAFWVWWIVVLATTPKMLRSSNDSLMIWAALLIGAVLNTIGWIAADLGFANRGVSYIAPTTEAVLLAGPLWSAGRWHRLLPWIVVLALVVTAPSILRLDATQTEVAWQSVVRLVVGLLALRGWAFGDRFLAGAILVFLVLPLPSLWSKEIAIAYMWDGWKAWYLVGYHMEVGAKLAGVCLLGLWLWRKEGGYDIGHNSRMSYLWSHGRRTCSKHGGWLSIASHLSHV